MRCITMTITNIEAVGAACSGTQCRASRGSGRTGQSLTLLQPSVQRVGGGLPVVETSHVGFPLPLADAARRARAGGRKLALAVLRPYARARQRHGEDERRGRTGARGARALGQANAEPAADGDFAARLARGAATRAVRVSCTVVGTQNHDRSSLQVVSKNS